MRINETIFNYTGKEVVKYIWYNKQCIILDDA